MKFLSVNPGPNGETVTASYPDFLASLRLVLNAITVDERWYLEQNPDIARAIEAGTIKSAKEHFVQHGYLEGRLPRLVTVDEQWYLANNPDVAEKIRAGQLDSAQQHFHSDGYREGRLPSGSDSGVQRTTSRMEARLRLTPP